MSLPYPEIIAEAERFIQKCRDAQKAMEEDHWRNKESAAAKRASMDLTRALTEFRRP